MDLDGDLAEPQFRGRPACSSVRRDEGQHLLLRAVNSSKSAFSSFAAAPPFAFRSCSIPGEPNLNRIQHVLIAKRLGQELDRTGPHRFHCHGNIAVAGHEYDGNLDARLGRARPWKSQPASPGRLTSSTRQLATSASLLRKKSAVEPNVSTLSLTDRNRLLRASRINSSSSTTNTGRLFASGEGRAGRSITGVSLRTAVLPRT